MWSRKEPPDNPVGPLHWFGSVTLAATLLPFLFLAACHTEAEDHALSEETPFYQGVIEPEELLEVPPPPFSPGIYPCSNCHGMLPVNRERRQLTGFHTEIVLHHDEDNRWCLDCHDAENRDVLHLASGAPVPFEESYRLCGQCHGEKYRDWRAGVHGRRVGDWDGHKSYLLCAHCHNPHAPRFQPLEPEPAPIPPGRGEEGQAP